MEAEIGHIDAIARTVGPGGPIWRFAAQMANQFRGVDFMAPPAPSAINVPRNLKLLGNLLPDNCRPFCAQQH